MTSARPVMEHTMMVSRKVPVIDTRPWRTGSFVCAAAAAIGAEPKPASLEKMPRAMPFCMAMMIAPSAPPAAARRPKALSTMVTSASGSAVMFTTIRMIENAT